MLKPIVCLLLVAGIAFGQIPASDEKIKKEIQSLQSAANEAVSAVVPSFGVLQGAKGTYLDEYGFILTMEVALETPRNPFDMLKSANDTRAAVNQRHKAIKERLTSLLKERSAGLESLAPTESATIIVYLLNTNPGDLPDLPTRIVLSIKKQDAAAGRDVTLREYK
jgi:hypothetical protein